MLNVLKPLKETPSQTAGPYVHIGCTPNYAEIAGVWAVDLGSQMVEPDTPGERIAIEGRIYDGGGVPLKDAMIEAWQADADGVYATLPTFGRNTPVFLGWGRQATDGTTGLFRFETIKPGRVPFSGDRLMAPHISVWIVARGINLGLHTRLYFDDEEAANQEDPVLGRIVDPGRRATLMARRSDRDGLPLYTFDIRLQGAGETVFFDI